MAPTVSAIIPIHNGERFLRSTLESVAAQTLIEWELVLVDDRSTDASASIAAEWAAGMAAVRVTTCATGNVAAARAHGLRVSDATAPYVAFLDQDDVWHDGALQTLTSVLDCRPDAVACHGHARFIDAEGKPIRPGEAERLTRERMACSDGALVPWPVERDTTFAVQVVRNHIHTPGQVLIRRSALARTGPPDPEIAPLDDYDLWLRLCALGPMAAVDALVLDYRRHDWAESRKERRMRRLDALTRWRLVRRADLAPEQRELALKANMLFYSMRGKQWSAWAGESWRSLRLKHALQQSAHALQDRLEERKITREARRLGSAARHGG